MVRSFQILKFTQAIHDALGNDKDETPLNPEKVFQTARLTTSELLKDDGVNYHLLEEENLQELLGIVKSATTDEEKLHQLLQEANAETQEYSERVIQKASNKKKKVGGTDASHEMPPYPARLSLLRDS